MKSASERKLFRAPGFSDSFNDNIVRLAFGGVATYESARLGISPDRDSSGAARRFPRPVVTFAENYLAYRPPHNASFEFPAFGRIFDNSFSSHCVTSVGRVSITVLAFV